MYISDLAWIFVQRSMQTVVENAMKKYLRTKPKPSQESVRRSKKVSDIQSQLLPQPLFASHIRIDRSEQERRNLLLGMRAYKPKSTIFEIGLNRSRSKISNTQPLVMMREKRLQDDSLISKFQSRHKSSDDKEDFLHHAHPATSELKKNEEGLVDGHEEDLEDCHEEDLEETFTDMIISKKPNTFFVPRVKAKRRKKPQSLDKEHFIHYSAPDSHSEQGLGVERTVFEREAKAAVLDFTMDDDEAMQRQKNSYKWDRKRKKFIKGGQEPKGKKIKSESGAWVSASYKGDRYEKWKKHHKVEQTEEDDDDEGMENLGRGRNKGRKTRAFTVLGQGGRGGHLRGRGRGRVRGERGVQGTRRELKTMDEIVKGRKLKKKREVLMSRRKTKKRQQRSR
ncbi:unnamed protein product [Darwinula stevensoni]|uniref:DBP10 C-terminal domain-containing protein n=1 Tax=Darwinula stevensoni TaxID=69355 RepID=A0A7R9AFG6_9CRUS|nr:unnamed protein product [Darwinula stevensoni]CAG0902961.1 unnamed protein product [Darwinula stevensoni]